MQADSCLNSEQIDTLFISVGGQEGGLGGGGYFGPEAQMLRVTVMMFFLYPPVPTYLYYNSQQLIMRTWTLPPKSSISRPSTISACFTALGLA